MIDTVDPGKHLQLDYSRFNIVNVGLYMVFSRFDAASSRLHAAFSRFGTGALGYNQYIRYLIL